MTETKTEEQRTQNAIKAMRRTRRLWYRFTQMVARWHHRKHYYKVQTRLAAKRKDRDAACQRLNAQARTFERMPEPPESPPSWWSAEIGK